MSRRLIRLAVTLDHLPNAFVTIEDDGTSTDEIGNYAVLMDDLPRKTQTKTKLLGWKRNERTGIELISAAFTALAHEEAATR